MHTDEKLEDVRFQSLTDDVVAAMAESFKALGDPTRLRLLALLFGDERCVGDLADQLSVSQSAVSHQLRILRNLDIVRYRRDGREIYYALADDHVKEILSLTVEHILFD